MLAHPEINSAPAGRIQYGTTRAHLRVNLKPYQEIEPKVGVGQYSVLGLFCGHTVHKIEERSG